MERGLASLVERSPAVHVSNDRNTPVEPFSDCRPPSSPPQLIYQRSWYVLSCF